MVRNLVAYAVLAAAGALLSLPDPALAGARGGAMPAFRPAMSMHAPRTQFFRGAHRPLGTFGRHRAPSTRPYGTINPTTPYGTINPSTPYGSVASSKPHGTVVHSVPRFARMTLSHPRSHLTRRHHRVYHAGWSFPLTVGGEVDYIGTPYDPAELIPVYGPAIEPAEPTPASPRFSGTRTREDNPDGCRSERVTVPAHEGEREITVVRC